MWSGFLYLTNVSFVFKFRSIHECFSPQEPESGMKKYREPFNIKFWNFPRRRRFFLNVQFFTVDLREPKIASILLQNHYEFFLLVVELRAQKIIAV